ncbi:MAG TPA: NUDIX domain-containing protein [Dehalococcoidia bacterium]|nr:NUDIX domain-containing protein [Dehalococcoidia bacterium]
MAESIMIGVGAVIEDSAGRILLVKHRPERGGYWQGKWICPGGKIEPGETIQEAIKREVKEETQLNIELVTPLHPFDRIVRSEDGTLKLHVIYIDYLAKMTGGTVNPGSDVGEAKWVSRERISEIWEELHDDTKKLLRIAKITNGSKE